MVLCEEVELLECSIVGVKQECWLFDGLVDVVLCWYIIVYQVVLGNYMCEKDGVVQLFDDQWLGYLDSCWCLFDYIQKMGFGNVVIVCGDVYCYYVSDLVQDYCDLGVVFSEFFVILIIFGVDGQGVDVYVRNQFVYSFYLKVIIDKCGYVLCDVICDVWIGDMKMLDIVMQFNGVLQSWKCYVVEYGWLGLQEV